MSGGSFSLTRILNVALGHLVVAQVASTDGLYCVFHIHQRHFRCMHTHVDYMQNILLHLASCLSSLPRHVPRIFTPARPLSCMLYARARAQYRTSTSTLHNQSKLQGIRVSKCGRNNHLLIALGYSP